MDKEGIPRGAGGAGPASHKIETGSSARCLGVLRGVNGETKLVDQLRQSTSHDPDMSLFIAQLIFRKHNLFGDDHRLVGEFKLTRKSGELNLRAEARDPRRKQ